MASAHGERLLAIFAAAYVPAVASVVHFEGPLFIFHDLRQDLDRHLVVVESERSPEPKHDTFDPC